MQATTVEIERSVPVTTYERRPVALLVPDFRDRVEVGAELLDNLRARFALADWRDEIDTGFLDLASGSACVLGQVFVESVVNGATTIYGQNYEGGVAFLFPTSAYAHLNDGKQPWQHTNDAARAHGFLITQDDVDDWDNLIDYDSYDEDEGAWELRAGGRGEHYLYEALTAAWVEYLTDGQGVTEDDDAIDLDIGCGVPGCTLCN